MPAAEARIAGREINDNKDGSKHFVTEDFKRRLDVAYAEWDKSGGRTPRLFFELMDEAIEFRSLLEGGFPADGLAGPFNGKPAVLAYYAGIAESWELLSCRTERLLAEGDTVVWIGRVSWRQRRTLRVMETPKVDVWTVWNGRAIRYLEMFDSFAYARAIGMVDPPAED
jgi:ketosteroid isomerase-like protein